MAGGGGDGKGEEGGTATKRDENERVHGTPTIDDGYKLVVHTELGRLRRQV